MSIEIKVPVLPESVANATVASWYKKAGEAVKRDENLVDIETDKVVLEVVAPSDGVLSEILKPQGSVVVANEVLAMLTDGPSPATNQAPEANNQAAPAEAPAPIVTKQDDSAQVMATNPAPEPGPSARQSMVENELDKNVIIGTGKDGRITKEDVLKVAEQSTTVPNSGLALEINLASSSIMPQTREQKRVPMSRLRATIAERLLAAQHNSAILTTFNEINMQPVMDLRTKYKEAFEKKNGVKLGFMSFFVKAVIEGLKRFPAVNAAIDGQDIVYNGYFDIGIAVSSERGLVVPVIRDADLLNMAEIESKIIEFGKRAQDGKITIEEITGGTFTISNGGVFGSLMSTPIINPPQSAILGMHKIEPRPVVIDNQIVIRPMMYVALSYDHRIIDGAESVQFLVAVKEMLEDPARFLLNI